jgi:hypothetical protein
MVGGVAGAAAGRPFPVSETPPPQQVVMPLVCECCGERGTLELLDYPQPSTGTVVIATCRCGRHEVQLPMRVMLGFTVTADHLIITGVPLDFRPD